MLYIEGMSCISAQSQSTDRPALAVLSSEEKFVKAAEPNYKERINPRSIRRFDKVTKMGLYSSLESMQNANVEAIDAVITGVGQTFASGPAKLLTTIIEHDEKFVNPLSFVSSLLSNASGQIALYLKCHGYNTTHSQRGFTFESALIDAGIQLEEKACKTILVGGVEEHSPTYRALSEKQGIISSLDKNSRADFLSEETNGRVGEGAAFFILKKEKSDTSLACIKGVDCNFIVTEPEEVGIPFQAFLEKQGLQLDDIDLVLSGKCFEPTLDRSVDFIEDQFCQNLPIIHFKKYCGEYATSTAFALWMGTQLFQNTALLAETEPAFKNPLKNIVIVNSNAGKYTTFIHIQKPQ